MPRQLEQDGLVQVSGAEFQSFTARAYHSSNSLCITIPSPIARAMGLAAGDLLEVAVRRVAEQYALEAYGWLPRTVRAKGPSYDTRRYRLPGPRGKATCPVCGKPGTPKLVIKDHRYRTIMIHHYKWDGYDQPSVHYVSKKRFPELWAEFRARLAGGREGKD